MPANQNTLLGVLSGLGLIIFAGYKYETQIDETSQQLYQAVVWSRRLICSTVTLCVTMRVRKLLLNLINRKQLRYLVSGELHTGPEYAPLEVYYKNMEVRWKPSHYLLNNNMVLWVYLGNGMSWGLSFLTKFFSKKLQQSSIHGTSSRCLNGAKCNAGIWHDGESHFYLKPRELHQGRGASCKGVPFRVVLLGGSSKKITK